jgi:hypothetical protein
MKKAPTTFHRDGAGEQLSLLAPMTFCPQMPARRTLAHRALKMLMQGRHIDHLDFQGETQSWRLAAAIFTLRSLGWPIDSQKVCAPTAQCETRVISVYTLDMRTLAQVLMGGT